MIKAGIIIPTIDRPEFVLRQLTFYNLLNCPHNIYIGDSSSSPNHLMLHEGVKEFSSQLNINLYHWPEKNDRQTIADLASKVQEDYCAFCGDDDFLFPSSITKCAEFLAANRDFASAQGKALIFKTYNDQLYGDIDDLSIYWSTNKADDDDLKKRLLYFSKNYWVTQFSVHRTSQFLKASEKYKNISDRSIAEYLHCFSLIAGGKSKFIDCLHLIRQNHEQRGESILSPTATSREERELSITWRESFGIFIKVIADLLIQESSLNMNRASEIADLCFYNVSHKKHERSKVYSFFLQIKALIKKSNALDKMARSLLKKDTDVLNEFLNDSLIKKDYIFFNQFIKSKVKTSG